VKDVDGKIINYASFSQDVTARLKAEQAEAEARQQAMEVERLKREMAGLANISRVSQTSVTAQFLGLMPLRESSPGIFNELIRQYGDLLTLALEQRAYKIEHNVSQGLRAISQQLGSQCASPRDVVEIHSMVMAEKTRNVCSSKANAYAEEGRIMVLQLMGFLVSHYRNFSLGSKKVQSGNKD
jgi:hypothetical protein